MCVMRRPTEALTFGSGGIQSRDRYADQPQREDTGLAPKTRSQMPAAANKGSDLTPGMDDAMRSPICRNC